MIIHKTDQYSLYFGTAQDALYPAQYLALPPTTPLLENKPYANLKSHLGISRLYFLRQTHSTLGYRVEESPLVPAFAQEGDYLITNSKGTGIGVMTADCLPIIMIDTKNHQLAMIHAGWRGSVAGIVQKALAQLNTDASVLELYFGPSARACCYEVNEPFIGALPAFREQTIQERSGRYYFDLPRFNELILGQAGIPSAQINTAYNWCTQCDLRFFSYRRQKEDAGRQMTVATLR